MKILSTLVTFQKVREKKSKKEEIVFGQKCQLLTKRSIFPNQVFWDFTVTLGMVNK